MSKEVLLLLGGGTLGILGTIIGVALTYFLQRRSLREQWEHEKEVREEERLSRERELVHAWSLEHGTHVIMDQAMEKRIVYDRETKKLVRLRESVAGCFVAGTAVRMNGGHSKPIEEVSVGDELESFDPLATEPTPTVVERTIEKKAGHYLLINGSLGVAESHLVFANGEFRLAAQLRAGDRLLDSSGNEVEVTSITLKEEEVALFNLETADGRGFFAEGLLVSRDLDSSLPPVLVSDHKMKVSHRSE